MEPIDWKLTNNSIIHFEKKPTGKKRLLLSISTLTSGREWIIKEVSFEPFNKPPEKITVNKHTCRRASSKQRQFALRFSLQDPHLINIDIRWRENRPPQKADSSLAILFYLNWRMLVYKVRRVSQQIIIIIIIIINISKETAQNQQRWVGAKFQQPFHVTNSLINIRNINSINCKWYSTGRHAEITEMINK